MIVDVAVSLLLLVITSVIQYYRNLARTKVQLQEEYGLKLAHCQQELKDAHKFIEILEVELKRCFRECLQREGLYRKVSRDSATQTPNDVTYKVSRRRTGDEDDLEIIGAIEAEVELRHYLHIIQSKNREQTGTGANRPKLDPGGSVVEDSICTEDALDNHAAESEKTAKENQGEPVETGQHCPYTIEGSGDENCTNHAHGCPERIQSQETSSKDESPQHEGDEIHQGCGKLNMQNEEFLDLLLMEDALLDNGPLSERAAAEDPKTSLEETHVRESPQKKPEMTAECGDSKRAAPGMESFTYYCSMDNYDLVTGPKGRNLQFVQQAFGVHVVVLQDDPRYKSLNVVGTAVQLTEARNYLENGVLGRIVERDLTRMFNSNGNGKW